VKSFQRELNPSLKKLLEECGIVSCEAERVETMSMENYCNIPELRLIIHLLNLGHYEGVSPRREWHGICKIFLLVELCRKIGQQAKILKVSRLGKG